MCGRFGCSLGSEDLSCATSYKDPATGLYVKIPCLFTEAYKPSCNIPPTKQAPIIINVNEKKGSKIKEYKPSLVLGRFGAIPPWLSFTDPNNKNNQYETHLCRFETITSSKVHGCLFKNGWRCVIPCTAYFEWQSTKGPPKQPYCFYNKNNRPHALMKTGGAFDETTGWHGVKLLYLAGLYSKHFDDENGTWNYSFAIITQQTSEDWSFVHHRMPMVLQTEEDIRGWLDVQSTPNEEALKFIKKPITNLYAHPVDKLKLNSPRNNTGTECFKELQQNKSNFITQWVRTLPAAPHNPWHLLPSEPAPCRTEKELMSQWLSLSPQAGNPYRKRSSTTAGHKAVRSPPVKKRRTKY